MFRAGLQSLAHCHLYRDFPPPLWALPERAEDAGNNARRGIVAQDLITRGLLVCRFRQDVALLYRCAFLGPVFSGERNREPVSAHALPKKAASQFAAWRSLAIRGDRLGPLDATDEEYGGDYLVAKWVSQQLQKKHDKPFFLACGIYRPHEPWFVPQKYFDAFPLEKIQLPPGYREDDLEDLPAEGKRLGPNRYFAHIRANQQWKQGLQGYLASIYFADTMLGHVLEALEKGPHASNTIVVLWSDHGWHLGEKQHWQKFTSWRACSRVPLIVRVPTGTPGLPSGTRPAVCERATSLLSLAPTLLQLCGLPSRAQDDGPSLVPLLENSQAEWPHVALTHLQRPGSFGLSQGNWRYIRYAGGGEELYDVKADPYEWKNLAADPAHQDMLKQLRARAPKQFAKLVEPKVASLPALKWQPVAEGKTAPPSKPDGNPFDVVFINRKDHAVTLYWMDREGGRKRYALIAPGKYYRQQTRPGAVWMIAGAESNDSSALGYFTVGDRAARAVIPK